MRVFGVRRQWISTLESEKEGKNIVFDHGAFVSKLWPEWRDNCHKSKAAASRGSEIRNKISHKDFIVIPVVTWQPCTQICLWSYTKKRAPSNNLSYFSKEQEHPYTVEAGCHTAGGHPVNTMPCYMPIIFKHIYRCCCCASEGLEASVDLNNFIWPCRLPPIRPPVAAAKLMEWWCEVMQTYSHSQV